MDPINIFDEIGMSRHYTRYFLSSGRRIGIAAMEPIAVGALPLSTKVFINNEWVDGHGEKCALPIYSSN